MSSTVAVPTVEELAAASALLIDVANDVANKRRAFVKEELEKLRLEHPEVFDETIATYRRPKRPKKVRLIPRNLQDQVP